MFYIKDSFTNYKNRYFDNIREVHFDKIEDIMDNIGDFILETHSNSCLGFSLNPGIYLYKSKYNEDKAYRVYKDFANYKYLYHTDDVFVSKLQSKQPKIKLTDFPTGVITIEGKIIGTEIPYYKDSITIRKYFELDKNTKIITNYYLEMLKILRELVKEGIIYKDINKGNFLVNTNDEKINLIDFDSIYTIFCDEKSFAYIEMIGNFKRLISMLNQMKNIEFKQSFESTKNLEELEESILENEKILIKQA